MDSFHGTSSVIATVLASGGVNTNSGGGELGVGFYTGEHLHEAKAWAVHQSGDRKNNVVKITIPDSEVEALDLAIFDYQSASLRRHRIRQAGATRTFRFGKDMIWAPIVGSERASGDQYKWESNNAANLLNSSKTSRTII